MKLIKKIFSLKIIRFFIIVCVLGGVGYAGYMVYRNVAVAASKPATSAMPVKVQRGDIDVSITGTGTVAPISRYDIVPLVKGNILSAPFEEGAKVKAGDLLYNIDDSDLSYNIRKAENSIEKMKINNSDTTDTLNNMEVYAPIEGRISNLTLNEGDQINTNTKVADITDDKHVTATVPFIKAQVEQIKVGQKAQLQLAGDWSTLDGYVKSISNVESYLSDGTIGYNVEIEVQNVGIEADTEVVGIVKGEKGDIISYNRSKVSNSKQRSATAQTSGKVKQVLVKNGDWVSAGQKLLTITNDSLNKTLTKNGLDMQDSQISLDAQRKQLNDYNILSPISGTVIKKYYKVGDTINNSSDSKILMTVADLSKMTFTIDVDELDVAKITAGQKVSITADALPQDKFEGNVTNVPTEGKSQNGVTTYPVQITISNPGRLKPGMNVNAQIVVESKKDVLYLPVSAVTKMGNRAFVLLKSDTNGSGGNNSQGNSQDQSNGQGYQRRQSNNQGDTQGQGRQSNRQQGNSQDQGNGQYNRQQGNSQGGNSQGRQSGNSQRNGSGQNTALSGYKRQNVEIGINNDNYIEIVSGLNEGDTVYIPITTRSSTSTNNNMGGMGFGGGGFGGGGFGGGGIPGGGVQRTQGQGNNSTRRD